MGQLTDLSLFFTLYRTWATNGNPDVAIPSKQEQRARRCQELVLAVPLVATLRGRVAPGDVRLALARVAPERDAMRGGLAEARRWEPETIRARGSVIEHISGLMR